MPTSKSLTNFVINKLESQDIYDYLSENSLINEDEIYLIEGSNNTPVMSGTPTDGQFLVYSSSASAFVPTTLTNADSTSY